MSGWNPGLQPGRQRYTWDGRLREEDDPYDLEEQYSEDPEELYDTEDVYVGHGSAAAHEAERKRAAQQWYAAGGGYPPAGFD